MGKVVLFLFIAIVLITFLRGVIGIVGKAIGSLSESKAPSRGGGQQAAVSGELKRDPVCGIFVAESTAVTRTVDGRKLHFCSEECAGRYRA